jgi:hypothetical protein
MNANLIQIDIQANADESDVERDALIELNEVELTYVGGGMANVAWG